METAALHGEFDRVHDDAGLQAEGQARGEVPPKVGLSEQDYGRRGMLGHLQHRLQVGVSVVVGEGGVIDDEHFVGAVGDR